MTGRRKNSICQQGFIILSHESGGVGVGMGWKDVVSIILGFLLGIPASMTATMVLRPALTIVAGFRFVRSLGRIRRRLFRDKVFDVPWEQTWHVESQRFPARNSSYLRLHRFLHLIAGEAEMVTGQGTEIGFRLLGVIDSNRYITGKWMDPTPGGYYGTFQMWLPPALEEADGLWVGFSATGPIKSGKWLWRRSGLTTSPPNLRVVDGKRAG